MAEVLEQLTDADLRGLAAWQGVPSTELLELAPEVLGSPKVRRVRAVAYSGAPVDRSFGTMIINLATLRIPESGKVPMMFRHGRSGMCDEIEDPNLGVWDKIDNDGKRLAVEGFLLNKPLADRVVADAKQGFPWQNSVGVSSGQLRQIEDGKVEVINGRECGAGMFVLENGLLREDSILELGADHSTPTEVELTAPKNSAGFVKRGAEKLNRLMTTLGIPLSAVREVLELDTDTAGTIALAASTGASDMATENKPVPATIPQLKALPGADADFVLASAEAGLSLEAAAVKLCEKHVARLASIEADHKSDIEKLNASHAEALKAAEAKATELQGRIDAALKAGATVPLQVTPSAPAAKPGPVEFTGATGTNPETDWNNCEALRLQWDDNRAAFLKFAKAEHRRGRSYLVAVK